MANLKTNKGDSVCFSEVITGLDTLSGYEAKLYIYEKDGTAYATVDGSIDTLTITYSMLNEVTKLHVVGVYNFETKIWNSSDYVYTPSKGRLSITSVLNADPS